MADGKLIFNNPFGINFQLPKKTLKEIEKVAKNQIKEISVNPIADYLEQNDKFFSGEVTNEIRKYQAQIYAMGQAARENQPIRTFKMKM
ncbi:hypothetical protein II906_11215 [bacterium]|nr:hypothetical protein [bacterium]